MNNSVQTCFLNSRAAASALRSGAWAKFQPWGLILICGMIGFIIGLVALSLSLKITLGLLLLLTLGIVGLMKPEIVAITLALLLPFHLEWEMPQLAGIKVGTTSLLVVVGLLSIIFSQFINRKARIPRIPHFIAWLLLALFMCAAYINSPHFTPDPVKIPWHLYRSILRFLLIFPLLFILIKTKGESLVKWTISALLISTTLIAAVGTIQTVLNAPIHPFHFGVALEMLNTRPDVQEADQATGLLRAFGSFSHSNAFAGFLVISIAISMGILFSIQKNRIWYLALISASIQIMALACTMSRGGWVAFSFSFIILSILARKKRLIAIGAILIFVVLIFLPAEHKKKFSDRAKSISKPSQVEEFTFRQKRWEAFLEMAIRNPILGTGSAVLDNPNEGEIGQTPHNMYLYFAVQNGIPALVLLVYFLGQLCYLCFKTFQRTQDSWHKAIALGALGAGIALIIHGSVDALIGLEQIWAVLWLLFAMATFVADQNKTSVKFKSNA